MSELEHHSTTSSDGTPISYFRRGRGPALVVTHGSIATKEQWIPVSEALAEHVTLYVYDRRGRGGTGDAGDYSLAHEVADIAAMREVAGHGAHLLGHSFGALATLAYAREHGLGGGTLLAYEPPLAVQGPVAGDRLAGYRELVDAGDLDAALEYALVNFVRVPAEAIPFIRETPLWGASVPLTPTWVRELAEIDALGSDLAPYAEIDDPTHLIAGTATTSFLYQSAHDLANIIPGAGITDIEGADHFAHLADPRGFTRVVVDALDTAAVVR
ncbi:pimeloyl-ACP methyl ester carboxylesterase [Microbacterium testaceum]|uniref:alpha/beta fold hydrolase n=1 Tax=Microbacterium TaxID=33882 RepID=UPI001AE73B0F|nr:MULTISPECIES: alpha/beta hydrolase [Microbacterium]MDQ1113570.1 pimeloyl-ACP methyl ester carboxylesterase [Microbacterium testaceum]MDR6099331.1 pimeloyl-ACP methyl ester carboxylesterase [Microbacterium sp. SORGH_AS_0454]